MKFNYDKVADAVYLKMNGGKIKKTIEMNDSVIVDVGEKGKLIGIEILNFSYQQTGKGKIADFVRRGVPLQISEATPVLA
ncbi:MAG: DUF2283 domain-containing protein [Candidatus Taylorbacteria bacterium]|nr:DUF2283 domain-containing protein [Candidatus Taylorbacteria bacterium]